MSRRKMTDNMGRVEAFENWWVSAGEEGKEAEEEGRGEQGRGRDGKRGRWEKVEIFVLAMAL